MADNRLRIMIGKPGLDGHDRGAKVIARALRDAGMEVIYTGLHQTPEMIVRSAVQEDVDAIGLSILSGAHMAIFPKIMELLSAEDFDAPESDVQYSTHRPKEELFGLIRRRIGAALVHSRELHGDHGPLARLAALRGPKTSILPETSFIRVRRSNGSDVVYTLLADRAHSNVAVLYMEGMRLMPEENAVTLVPGFIGAYPNAFFVVEEVELERFVDEISGLESEEDYARLQATFGIRRTNRDFWKHADWFQEAYRRSEKGLVGLIDYSRLENR